MKKHLPLLVCDINFRTDQNRKQDDINGTEGVNHQSFSCAIKLFSYVVKKQLRHTVQGTGSLKLNTAVNLCKLPPKTL